MRCYILEIVPGQAEGPKGRKLTKKVFGEVCLLWTNGMCQDDAIRVGCYVIATLRFPPGHLLVPPGNLPKLGTGDLSLEARRLSGSFKIEEMVWEREIWKGTQSVMIQA